ARRGGGWGGGNQGSAAGRRCALERRLRRRNSSWRETRRGCAPFRLSSRGLRPRNPDFEGEGLGGGRPRPFRYLLPQVGVRVHRLTVQLDLVVQVGAGGTAGVSSKRNE